MTRISWALLLLLGLAAPVWADPAAVVGVPALELDVMSFNIRYGTAADGDDAWALRREMVVDLIVRENPAVLGVQEALRFQLLQMLDDLPGYRSVGVGRDDGYEAGEFSPILFDSHRLELLAADTFWFSDHPECPGSIGEGWGNRIPRICTWARLRDRQSGLAFTLFNLHWDHEAQESRLRGARLLQDRIARREEAGEPVLVTGDFNAGERNQAFRRLLRDKSTPLRDSFRERHPKAENVGTFNGFEGRRDGEKIDAVLVSPHWRVLAAEILHDNRRGRYPSDHFPVTARLSLPRPPMKAPETEAAGDP
jgi:endonuclease/exonuclease/phosphatase family metal-dependent hydrolase